MCGTAANTDMGYPAPVAALVHYRSYGKNHKKMTIFCDFSESLIFHAKIPGKLLQFSLTLISV